MRSVQLDDCHDSPPRGLDTVSHAGGRGLCARGPKVKFTTTAGDFVVEVYPDKAPKTVENFLQYVKDKHYDGTTFHRVIPNFAAEAEGVTPEHVVNAVLEHVAPPRADLRV